MNKNFYTDTHAHIHMGSLKNITAEVVSRAVEKNIKRIVTIGISLSDSKNALKVAEKFKGVYATVGVHPHDAEQFNYKELGEFEKMALNPKVIAVGEVGLDYYRNLSPKEVQKEVFSMMIDLALASNLPLVIHSRDSTADTASVLDSMLGGKDHPVLLHCFSGDKELIEWGMAKKNVMFSFAGNVTYKKALALHEALDFLPLERLFIETDCPYLTPEPHRGKQNEPMYLPYTADYVAKAKGITVEKLLPQLEDNFIRFFGEQAANL